MGNSESSTVPENQTLSGQTEITDFAIKWIDVKKTVLSVFVTSRDTWIHTHVSTDESFVNMDMVTMITEPSTKESGLGESRSVHIKFTELGIDEGMANPYYSRHRYLFATREIANSFITSLFELFEDTRVQKQNGEWKGLWNPYDGRWTLLWGVGGRSYGFYRSFGMSNDDKYKQWIIQREAKNVR